MELPTFLKPFKTELEAYKRQCVSIKLTPLEIDATKDKLPLTASKLLGLPFLPKTKTYPKDSEGQAMLLLAQLNFADIPSLENFPQKGILQLYLSPTNWYDDEAKVLFIHEEELTKEAQTDFSFITQSLYGEMPAEKVHQLSFESKIDIGSMEDSQFDMKFNGEELSDFEDALNEEEQKLLGEYFDGFGHKIGGYATFAQDDPREDNDEKQHDIQLFQLESEETIMIGDTGICHIFISKEHLINQDFEQAYFTWDCY